MAAMDFRGARGKLRDLVAAKKPQQQQTSALTPDAFRDNVMREERGRSPRFDTHASQRPQVGESEWTNFGDALMDAARANFQIDEPTVADAEQVRPSHQLEREIARSFLSSKSHRESRPYTRGNATESAYGAMAAGEELIRQREQLGEHIERAEQMREQEDAYGSADEMFEQLRKRARQEVADDGEVADPTKREIKQALKARDSAAEQLGNLVDQQQSSGMRIAASIAGGAAADAQGEAVETISGVPGTEPGSQTNVSPDKQIEIAEKWQSNPQLREILAMVGRLRVDMRAKRRARSKNVKVEPVGVTNGNDIEVLLPHEMARAYMPATKPLWMKDFRERQLLQYEMGGKVPMNKGPLIVGHDGSGSMAGEKFIWASSVAIALCLLARRERRDFYGIEFGWRSELATWEFRHREPVDPDVMLDYAGHFFNGGTDTTIALREALRVVTEVPGFSTADVVLISDGQDNFEQEDVELVRALQAKDVRIHGISILTPNNRFLGQACEYVVDVEDLAGPNNATDRVAENLT